MNELDYLLSKSGFVKRSQTENNLPEIENIIGFSLPDDYCHYLNNYQTFDGLIGQDWVVLYAVDELFESNKISNDLRSSKTIAIGSNGASETIGIRFLEANDYKIIIAQYIHNIEDQIEIGLSFTDMINRLNNGLPWFR